MPHATALRFGSVQGRLIQAPPGSLQWFPQDDWQAEFFIAAAVGVDYIELIAERAHNPNNPLWSDDGIARLRDLVARNGMSLHAFCNDYIIDHSLPSDRAVLDQNIRLIRQGRKLGCEKYVLPLFEASELTAANRRAYKSALRAIADEAGAAGITVCLETILTGRELIDTLVEFDHTSLAVVYDTGNRVAFGHDLPADIRLLGERICHVHIKDKNAGNQNVLLGTGLVNFKAVFEALKDIGYSGPYTFETQRGVNPVRTTHYNIGLVTYFHQEAAGR